MNLRAFFIHFLSLLIFPVMAFLAMSGGVLLNPQGNSTNENETQVVTAVSDLSYNYNRATFIRGVSVIEAVPSYSGSEATFTVDTVLPDGLSLDASTGIISGNPTTLQALLHLHADRH